MRVGVYAVVANGWFEGKVCVGKRKQHSDAFIAVRPSESFAPPSEDVDVAYNILFY